MLFTAGFEWFHLRRVSLLRINVLVFALWTSSLVEGFDDGGFFATLH